MAKELVDGVITESLAAVSVKSAINAALVDLTEDGYYSESTTCSERRCGDSGSVWCLTCKSRPYVVLMSWLSEHQ